MSYYKGSSYGGSRGGYRGGSSSYRGGGGGGGNDSSWRGGRGGSSFSSSRTVTSSSGGGGGSSRYYPSSPPSSSYESRSRSSYVGGTSATDRYSSRRDESYNRYPEMSSYSSREYGRGSSPEPPRKRVRADSPSYIDLRSPPPNTKQPRYSSEEEQINTRKSKKPLMAGVDNEIHQISTNNMPLTNTSLILPYQQKENELDNIRLREKGHFVSLDNESEKLSSEISCYSSASDKEFKKNFVQGYCKSVREGKYESNSVTVMNSLNANKDWKVPSSEPPSEQVQSETSKNSLPENQRQVLKKLANLMGSINEEIDKTCVIDCNNSPDKVWCEELKSLVTQLESTVSKKIVKSSSVSKMDPIIPNEVSVGVRKRPSRWDSQNDFASDTPLIKSNDQFSSYSNQIVVNESVEHKVLRSGNENNLPRTSKGHPKYFSQVNPSSPAKEKIVSDSPREWLSSSVYNCISSNSFQSIASNNTLRQNSDIGNSFNKANLRNIKLQEQYIKFLETLGDGICNKEEGSEINYSKTSAELSRADEPFELKICTTQSDCVQERPELYGTSKKRLPGAQRRKLKKLAKLLGCGYEEIYKMCVIDCSNSGDKDWCEDLKNLVIELENKTKKNINLSSSLDLQNDFTSDASSLTKSNEKFSSKTKECVNEFHKNVTLRNNRPKHVIQVLPQCSTKTDTILNKCCSEVLSQKDNVSSNKVNTIVPCNHNVNYRSNTKCSAQSNQLAEQRLLPTDLDQVLTEFLKEILEFQKNNRLIKTQGPDAGTCTIKCKDWESYSILQLKISKLERLSSDASIQFNVSTDFTNFETTFGIFDFLGRPINLLQSLENNSGLDFSEDFQVEVDDTLINFSDKDFNSNKKSKLSLAEDRCETKNSDRPKSERINVEGNNNINNSIKHLDGNKSVFPKSVCNKDSIVVKSTIVANAETVPIENYPDAKKQYKRLCGSQKRRLKTLRKIGQCGTNIQPETLTDGANSNSIITVIGTYYEPNQPNKKCIINSTTVENEPTHSETILDYSTANKKGKHLCGSRKRILKPLRKIEEFVPDIQPAALTVGANSNSVITVNDTYNENNQPNTKCIMNSETVANKPTNSETIPDNSTVKKKALIDDANSNPVNTVIDTYNEINQQNKKSINSTIVENEPTNSETIPDNSTVKKKGKHLSGSQKRKLKALRKMEESGVNIKRKMEEPDANIQPAALTDDANSNPVNTVIDTYNEINQPNKKSINSTIVANEPTNSETIPDNSIVKKKALIDGANSNPVNTVIDTYNEINQQNKKSIINSTIVENEPTNSETIPDNSTVKKQGKHLSGSQKRKLKALRKMEESGANIKRKMEEPDANIQPAALTDGANSNSIITVIDTNNENNQPNTKCVMNAETVANEPTNSETIPDNSTVKKKGKHLSGSQKRRLKALRKMEESGANIERKVEEPDANIQPETLTDSANSNYFITVTEVVTVATVTVATQQQQ